MKSPLPNDRGRHTRRILSAVAKAGARRLVGSAKNANLKLGEELLSELDQMKGMAMKVGQILSYLDGLPEETQAALSRLQQGVTACGFDTIQAQVEAGLGAPLGQLFEHFEPEPVAAASIGQVHRARFAGQDVAVKVQYPEIQSGFEADLQRLERLGKIGSLVTQVDGSALVRELGFRLHEECDYAAEAENQNRFRILFETEPDIVVPDVLPERSSTTVLTTRWQEGVSFSQFVEQAKPEQRARAGLAMARFAWTSLLSHNMLNADPHPGNFLFQDERVVFLDFGCVRRFSKEFMDAYRALIHCVLEEDRQHFPEKLEAVGLVGQRRGFDFEQQWRQVRYEFEPYQSPHFRFTREYSARAAEFSKPTNPNSRKIAIPPPYLWILRMQYGLHAVLARLGAEGDFGTVMRTALGSA